MNRISEQEYLAAMDLCKRYQAQIEKEVQALRKLHQSFPGINNLGLPSVTRNALMARIHSRIRYKDGFSYDKKITAQLEIEELKEISKDDLRNLRGIGVKGRKEIMSKLAEYGIEIK